MVTYLCRRTALVLTTVAPVIAGGCSPPDVSHVSDAPAPLDAIDMTDASAVITLWDAGAPPDAACPPISHESSRTSCDLPDDLWFWDDGDGAEQEPSCENRKI